MLAIGVDIGGSHILCAAIDLNKLKIAWGSENHEKVDPSGTKGEIFKHWATALNKTIKFCGASTIEGIGFAMPGPFDYEKGIAQFKGANQKFETLNGVNIREELPAYLSSSNLKFRFLNDAISFGVGVAWFGEAKGHYRSLILTLGTGFGSTFIEGGTPITSRNDVPENGFFWNVPFRQSIADDYFSTRWFTSTYNRKFGRILPGVKDIAEEARTKPETAEIFDEFGSNLGEFLAPWLSKFPADIIVLGGNISKAFDLFEPALNAYLDQHNCSTEVKVACDSDDAALLGSAMLFQDDFWNRIKQ